MTGLDPRLVIVLCLVFIGIGIFNIMMGRRRLHAAQAQGLRLAWYRQTAIMTGIEYILLSLMFLLSTGISSHWFPVSLNAFLYPLYLVFLFASAALAGVIIYMVMQDNRRRRAAASTQPEQSAQSTQSTQQPETHVQQEMTPEEREAAQQRRRERRKKAAEARRRRAGKA